MARMGMAWQGLAGAARLGKARRGGAGLGRLTNKHGASHVRQKANSENTIEGPFSIQDPRGQYGFKYVSTD